MSLRDYVIAAGIIIGLVCLYYLTPLHYYLQLETMRTYSFLLKEYVDRHLLLSLVLYLLLFSALVMASFPISVLFTLLGGYLFGIPLAVVLATTAVVLGTCGAYSIYRWLIHGVIFAEHQQRLQSFKEQMQLHGLSYLLMLHFSTVVPYAMINLLAAGAQVPMVKVIIATALGFIPQAVIYAFAGRQLATIKQVSDIFSWPVIIAFVTLMVIAYMPVLVSSLKGYWSAKK